MILSSKQLKKIAQNKIFKFFGGIKPKEMKDTSDSVIEELKIPSLICLPIERHLGSDGEILVNVGDHVKKGQKLTAPNESSRLVPVHASTSGTVSSISKEILPHPSGYTGLCITIKPDGFDEAVDPTPILDWEKQNRDILLARIKDFGVEGMGGAQFQTEAKLSSAVRANPESTNVLIINGCECEPAITCDDRLMQERATEIALGIKILKKILNPKITIVAIEDNKKNAIAAMSQALGDIATIRVLPTKYPTGAARNVIKAVTGIEIPYKAHTSEAGVVINNISTVLSIKEAIVDGIPVISRVVTVTGDSLKRKANIKVRLGTSVRFLLSNLGLNPEYHQRIILGGPMMGFTLPTIDVPITKSNSCVLAPSTEQIPRLKESSNCIRCGRCARVCPSRLVPYQMYAQSKSHNHAACQKAGIFDCSLCGACSYVCPSFIPLTAQFRYEKAVEKHIYDAEVRNARAKQRMLDKEQRLKKEEEERQLRKLKALEKIKAQKEAEAKMTPEELAKAKAKALEEAKLLAKQRKEAMLAGKKAEEQNSDHSEKERLEKLKLSKMRAKEIALHQGRQEKSILPESNIITEEIKTDNMEEKILVVPDSLRKTAGKKDVGLEIKTYDEIPPSNNKPKLVGLEPDDSLKNPEPKKVIPQVLLSHNLDFKQEIVLPKALRKKTLRTKK